MKTTRIFLVGAMLFSLSGCAAAVAAGVGLWSLGRLNFEGERVEKAELDKSGYGQITIRGTIVYHPSKIGGEQFFNLGDRQVEMELFDNQGKRLLTLLVTPLDENGSTFIALPASTPTPFKVEYRASRQLWERVATAKLKGAGLSAEDEKARSVRPEGQ